MNFVQMNNLAQTGPLHMIINTTELCTPVNINIIPNQRGVRQTNTH